MGIRRKNSQCGSISVYLALIFLTVFMLVVTLLEGSRILAARAYMEEMTAVSANSLQGSYCRELFEEYGLLFYLEQEQTGSQLTQMVTDCTQGEKTDGTGWNFYQIQEPEVCLTNPEYALERNATQVTSQIIQYTKYLIPKDMITKAKKQVTQFQEAETADVEEEEKKHEEVNEALSDAVKEAQKAMEKAVDVKGTLLEYMNVLHLSDSTPADAKKAFGQLKRYVNRVKPLVEQAEKAVNHCEELIVDYQKNASADLEDGVSTEGMEQNLQILRLAKQSLEDTQSLLSHSKKEVGDYFKTSQPDLYGEIHQAYNAALNYNLSLLHLPERQEKKESVIDQVKKLVQNGKLALVVEDVNRLSKKTLNLSGLPTQSVQDIDGARGNLEEKVLVCLYMQKQLGSYRTPKKGRVLDYELEYCLVGKESDRENLDGTVNRLVLIREGFNFVHLLRDSGKRSQCSAAATGIVGWTGVPFLVTATKYLLMGAWALGESLMDVKSLLAGGKIPLVKDPKDWQLGLEQLGQLSSKTETEQKKKGLDYLAYLQCMLVLQSVSENTYRIMDLIQANLTHQYGSDFTFARCVGKGKIQCKYGIGTLFTMLPGNHQFTQEIEFSY